MGASQDNILEHIADRTVFETRAENIKNDLLLEHTYGKPVKAASPRVATDSVTAKAKAIPNPSYEAQVDAYIKGLETSKEIEKPFEKVK